MIDHLFVCDQSRLTFANIFIETSFANISLYIHVRCTGKKDSIYIYLPRQVEYLCGISLI